MKYTCHCILLPSHSSYQNIHMSLNLFVNKKVFLKSCNFLYHSIYGNIFFEESHLLVQLFRNVNQESQVNLTLFNFQSGDRYVFIFHAQKH
jgi:hypothetical protein